MSCHPTQPQAAPVTWYGVFMPGESKPRMLSPFHSGAAMFILEAGIDNKGAEIRPVEMGVDPEAQK